MRIKTLVIGLSIAGALITGCGSGGGAGEKVGTGTSAPIVNLSTASLSFSATGVGSISAVQTITLSNIGNATLVSLAISLAGASPADFSETNNCGSMLAPGASCIISAQFNPAAPDAYSADINISDNASGSPQTIAISGTGTVAPLVSLSATTLTFPSTSVGSNSAIQTITLQNTGNTALNNVSITLAGTNPADFSETNGCGSMIIAGASCVISVVFSPIAPIVYSAVINIFDSASGSPQTVALSGTGTAAPLATLSATSLTFPGTGVGSTSAVQSVTLTNVGNATLNGISITLSGGNSGDFTETNNCGSTLGAGASCAISITLNPPCTGSDLFVLGSAPQYLATVSVVDNAVGSPESISLFGTGLSSASVNLGPGKIFWGADGHRDKADNYAAVPICNQISDLKTVFGKTPDTIFYRAWDSVHDYNFDASSDIVQMQAAGIIPLVGVVVDPPSLPGGSILSVPTSTYADGFAWGYQLAQSDAQEAPTNICWFVGNEWNNLIPGADPYPDDPTNPAEWRAEPLYQAYLGAMAGAIQGIRQVIPNAKIVSGANGGTTSIGLTLALAQDLQTKNISWDYTNLHWYNDYASTQSYQAHYESPADFYGAGSFANETYDAYTLLSSVAPALFVDEYGSSNGDLSTASIANDARAGIASVDLMSELLSHSTATANEKGVVAATYYQLYPLSTPSVTSDVDKYLFTVSSGNTSISDQGKAIQKAISQNPTVNAMSNFVLTASPVSAISPGQSATSTIAMVPGSGFSGSATLTCMIWSESQSNPSFNPSCNFGGQTSASIEATTNAVVTITSQTGTAGRSYVLTIIGTTSGSSTDKNLNFVVN